jgi:immune inhibitor A
LLELMEGIMMSSTSNPHPNFLDEYRAGPTSCLAHPDVMASIRDQLQSQNVLSSADARLATLAGMLDIPPVGKTGFNDGTIYPPAGALGPVLAAATGPTARLSLQPAAAAKTSLHCLVLLVDFSDNIGAQSPSHFDDLLFDTSNSNSMTSFYKDLSYGKLAVTGQVTPWIRAAHPYSFYTAGQSGTGNSFPNNTPGLLQEALQAFCAGGSLAGFDLNGDGFVDGLFLIHAGGGAEAEPDPVKRRDMIWSHKWTLPSVFTNSGIKAFAYFTAPEDGKLGVFSHEFGHFLGLPDLYDTSYRSSGIGDWCLMAGGSWNGGGDMPARMSAWCLSTLGWIKPRNIKSASSLTLETLEKDKKACCRLWTAGKLTKEYFLIENRQKKGRDAKLPGKGLTIWHIDESQSDNTNPLAYKVALVQADGKRQLELGQNQGDAGDLFPGSKKVTKVNDTSPTHPHLRSNSGVATGVSVSKIALSAARIISCDVKV